MSLQEYAIHITHAVRTSLNKIKRKAAFFAEFFPDPNEDEFFMLYAHEILDEMNILDKVINYMLSYSQANVDFQEIDLQELIETLFRTYETQFKSEKVTIQKSFSGRLILKTNRQFFYDILQNIVNNSIKSMSDSINKIIKCSAFIENEQLVLQISDTGIGIPIEKREWVFGLYNTTTEKEGGAGVGLYVVKMRVESLRGNVKITDSEFGDIGSTIRIELPFKK